MKLTEVSYAGDHPVIREIKDIVDNRRPTTYNTNKNFYEIEPELVPRLVKTLTHLYGEPRTGRETWHWNFRPDANSDLIYEITIGHDEEYNPPYGLEINHTRRNVGVHW